MSHYHWWYEELCPQVGSKSRTEERCCSPHQLWAHCRHTIVTTGSSASTHLHFHCCAHHKLMKAGATLALEQPSLCWRCFEINIDSISLKHTNKPSYHTNQLAAMLDNHALMWVLISTVDQNYVKWMDWYVWNGCMHHEVIMEEVYRVFKYTKLNTQTAISTIYNRWARLLILQISCSSMKPNLVTAQLFKHLPSQCQCKVTAQLSTLPGLGWAGLYCNARNFWKIVK